MVGMRAIHIRSLDGPSAAELVEIDEPAAAEDSVVVDVHAAGVAFPDALQSRGLYQYKPELPYVPGAEIAGVVRSAPEGAHVRPGDRVAGLTMLSGAMAEVVALQAERVFALPDAVSFEAGAGLLFNDLTVHFALRTRGRLREGETVLVHGAAGASAPRRCGWRPPSAPRARLPLSAPTPRLRWPAPPARRTWCSPTASKTR